MQNSLLLPSKYKVFGWIIFLLFAALGVFCIIDDFEILGFDLIVFSIQSKGLDFNDYNLTNELAFLGITIGLLMIVFAKENIENEYISIVRLKSLQWTVLASYIVLIILNFSFFGLSFLMLIVYNLWTTLLVFIIKFHYSLYQSRGEVRDDK